MLYNLPLKERVLGPILAQAARTEGKRTYLRIQDKSYTFEEAYLISRAVARGFRAQGLAKQESVALLLPNCAEFVFSWDACCLIGAVMAPVNPAYTGYMLEYVLADSKAKGLVVTRLLLPALATVSDKVRPQLKWVAVVGGCRDIDLPAGPGCYLDFKDLQVTAGADPEELVTYEDIQCIMYTSGTTGPSKGVVMPNGHFFASTCVFLRAVGLNRDDILFTPFPLFHGMASRLGVLPALMVGAEIVVAERFSSSKFWQQVCKYQATFAHTLFTIPPILKGQAPGPYDRAHRLRGVYNAHYDSEFEKRFGVRLFEAYGLAETGLVIATEFPHRREGSCGHVVEDWEAEIMDNNDFPLPPGEVGEIVLRPKLPSIMMKGYLNQPEATLEAFQNLWFHTGDFAKRDADGYFYFADRKKERI
ncbi:MAG: AMP-binding protein, partial [Deltaproteobacteria bacterium]|nr:AMP-binding protein [Deltaproteobacteria bacterium]